MKKRIFISAVLSVLLLAALTANVNATEVKLTASDGAAGDCFGISVAISGDYAVVGACYNDSAYSDSGSAYIFERNGTAWTQQAKITASDGADGAADDYFGYSIAISGDYAVVGASHDDCVGSNSGSAYIYDIMIEISPVPAQHVFDTADAGIALRIAVGSRPPDLRWDVSGDKRVTALDALMIMQAVAGAVEL